MPPLSALPTLSGQSLSILPKGSKCLPVAFTRFSIPRTGSTAEPTSVCTDHSQQYFFLSIYIIKILLEDDHSGLLGECFCVFIGASVFVDQR